ncbi:maleylacetoacetate isomerase [Reinekea sp. G2M2-21]|jgi:maleylacetoacetate isomerase|uniref:maleylacetoacetate isomerase n=1 Tax=Reinekea sp. G2M2-21 TaxID=2788942 RepID=UPI0018ABE2E3|nr:maleylacetoacetate isomerase [Reinekea sp. G2M2-21]MDX1343089.1 maleylacetoacetate isomerase [Reinekea sp.]
MQLFTYFRSSAAFRVRIALNLKELQYESKFINIKPGEDEQFSPAYLALNPQGRIPFIVDGDVKLGQSTAILEYLDEQYPHPKLLPGTIKERGIVRQMVNAIACDIHPLNNLSVLKKLKADFGASQEQCDDWYRDWIMLGFGALEPMLKQYSEGYSFGSKLTMADVYLVPQVWNAKRFSVDLRRYPTISRIYDHCLTHDAVRAAMPEHQKDNPDYTA